MLYKLIKENEYLGNEYTEENVDEYFSKIETYSQLEEFQQDFFEKMRMFPIIVPRKHSMRQWVANPIKAIDDYNIIFWVLSFDFPYQRKTKSSIKNFVKNYMVRL